MSATTTQKKLRLEPGHTALVINPPGSYSEILGSPLEGIQLTKAGSGKVDFVHLFIRDKSDLVKFLGVALQSIKYDGMLWISYPKGSSKVEIDLNRDTLWDLLKDK